jgi:LysM repeat protein
MAHKLSFILPLALLASVLQSPAASSGKELEKEYEQVRKIALRDPKVKAAFANAQQRLEAKIIELDPALAPYARQRSTAVPAAATTAQAALKLAIHKAPPRRTHVVVKGDTLASIARTYGLSVADLRGSNTIADERKLAIGQVLTIPASAPARKKSLW